MSYGVFSLAMVCLATGVWASSAGFVAHRTRFEGTPLAIHPLMLTTVFLCLVLIDFIVLYMDVASDQLVNFSRRTISNVDAVSNAALVYSALLIAAAAGLAFGGSFVRAQAPKTTTPLDRRAARLAFLVVLGLTLIVFTPALIGVMRSGNILAIASMRMVFAHGSQILALLILMLAPAALLYASRARTSKRAYVAIAATMVVYLLFGSRFNIMMLLYGAVLVTPIRKHLTWPVVLASLPFAFGFLSIYGYATRFTYAYDSYGEYLAASGGFFSSFFRSLEMSIAEAMTVHLGERLIDRSWYESLLAGAVALVPRELIPWKPNGLSTALTLAADPARWLLVRSEWTVGGFTNLVYELGLFGGLVGSALIFAILGIVFRRLNGAGYAVFWWPMVFVLILGFLRADIYNVSLKLWALVIVFIMYAGFQALRYRSDNE